MRHYMIGFSTVALVVVAVAPRTASAQLSQFHSCGGRTVPDTHEVFLYTDGGFGGACAALYMGLYPYSAGYSSGSFGLPNDSISSLRVGAFTRVSLFTDGSYQGSVANYVGGDYWNIAPGWNDVVSSIRVTDDMRSNHCSDLRDGEFAVFSSPGFSFLPGDCVVLHYGQDYPSPELMGIANDTISSINTGPGWSGHATCGASGSRTARVILYAATGDTGGSLSLQPNVIVNYLGPLGFDNVTSSIRGFAICP